MTWFDSEISIFTSATSASPSEHRQIAAVLDDIRSGRWRQLIARIRSYADLAERSWRDRAGVGRKSEAELAYDAQKKQLSAATFSGRFSYRREDSLELHSGILLVDLDHVEDLDRIRLVVEADPHTAFCFVSPSGHGLKVGLVIDGSRHRDAFAAAERYFLSRFGAQLDRACKDPSRLCFLSDDPALFLNEDAIALPLEQPTELPIASVKGTASHAKPLYPQRDEPPTVDEVRELLRYVAPRPAYPEWIRIIAAVSNGLPNVGDAVAVLNEWSPEEHPGEYELKVRQRLERVSYSTLVWEAQQRGYVHPRRATTTTAPMSSDDRVIPPPIDDDRSSAIASIETPATPGDADRAAPARFNLTDYGNAERLVAQHGKDLRHVHAWGKWLSWDGHRWERDETGEVDRRAKASVRSMYLEAAACDDASERVALATHAKRSEAAGKIKAMITLASSESAIAVRHTELDQDAWKLNVLNGTIDLRTGRILKHDRADLITKLAPVVYDPAATCPTWVRFLRQIMGDNDDLIGFVRRAIGYSVTASVREQCLFFLYGSGSNGKSTLLDTILEIVGEYGLQAPRGLLIAKQGETHPTEFASLFRQRFVVCHEVDQGKRFAEETVKQLTGGDRVSTRRMREDWWEFDPTHKLFLAANHKPRIRGTDHAIWRRMRLIPFTVTITDDRKDPDLKEKLLAERSGILNWIVEGCMEWQEEGLGTPSEVLLATEQYRVESDSLSGFFADCCEIGDDLTVEIRILYDRYVAYENEQGGKPMTKRAFGMALSERGFGDSRTGSARYRTGIGLPGEAVQTKAF